MRFLIVILCILLTFSQDVVLVQSGVSSTTIISPLLQTVAISNYHTIHNINYLADGSQWIWSNSDSVANGQIVTFQSLFNSDCSGVPATFIITADKNFMAYLNGVFIGSGNNIKTIYAFSINLACGINNLTVSVANQDKYKQAALVFSIHQTQDTCFNSCAQNGFYNPNTCSCSCFSQCPCSTNLTQWVDYPTCGCKCSKLLACPRNQYFNPLTCQCQCRPICPLGYYQDSSCGCVKGCKQNVACTIARKWDSISCRCVCNNQYVCPIHTTFDKKNCQCTSYNSPFPL